MLALFLSNIKTKMIGITSHCFRIFLKRPIITISYWLTSMIGISQLKKIISNFCGPWKVVSEFFAFSLHIALEVSALHINVGTKVSVEWRRIQQHLLQKLTVEGLLEQNPRGRIKVSTWRWKGNTFSEGRAWGPMQSTLDLMAENVPSQDRKGWYRPQG